MDTRMAEARTALELVNQRCLQNPAFPRRLLELAGANLLRDHQNELRCCCPLHGGDGENNFALFHDRGFLAWRCFSGPCGHGDLVKFVQQRWNLRFFDAVDWLCKLVGLTPGDVASAPMLDAAIAAADDRTIAPGSAAARPSGPVIFPEELVAEAKAMAQTPAAAAMWGHFIDKEGFTRDAMAVMEYGFVPAGRWVWPVPDDRGRSVDRGFFEDRAVTFWRDEQGRCVGVSGRRLDGRKLRKWKNLHGTDRTNCLYGLFSAGPFRLGPVSATYIIVEGQSDVLRARQHGIGNVAASGGSSLTQGQADLLARHGVEHVVLFPDGDPAGRDGVTRSLEVLRDGFRVSVVDTPDGVDPGDVRDTSAFHRFIRAAKAAS